MNPQFDEVLLTAYLDNEVTDEERASVEDQLQSSEASRKLLEELRSVRNLVAQLHLSLPARRFQQGPWNEPPKAVLNETRWYWTMPLQRLASLAALIAIAVCASVLLMGPNTKSVSRISESGRTETASDATVAPNRSLSELSKTEEIDGALGMQGGSHDAKSDFTAAAKLDDSELQRQDVSANQSSIGFSQPQAPKPALEIDPKSKLSETLAYNPPPAPAPALARIPPAMPSIGMTKESKSGVGGFADDSEQVVERFEKLENSRTRGSNEFKKEIFFRYRSSKTDRQSGISSSEKPRSSPIEESLGKNNSLGSEDQRFEDVGGIVGGAMLVEFQIPIENWELGAHRLRKLGMDVPEKLPTVEYLDFNAIPIAGTNGDFLFNAETSEMPIDRFVVDVKAAKDAVLSQWRFLAVAPKETETPPESETPAKEQAAKDKKENRPSSSTIRIRVRPIR